MSIKKIGYLGPEGTFSQDAGFLYLKKLEHKADLIPFSTIHDLLIAVDKKMLAEGIVPIENSIEGTIGIVADMLVKEVDLKIKNEIIIPIHHFLLAKGKISLGKINEVISHPQPIEQCRTWLRKHLTHAKITLSYSTAEAAKHVALSEKENIAAIASRGSAELYKLKILVKDITEYRDNLTRFVILSKQDHAPTKSDKTSIVFSITADKPGGLHKILEKFAIRDINLTKIESRPSKKALGDYFFFVDMEGHRFAKSVAGALKDIKDKVSFMKILGSYPKGVK